MYFTNIVVCFWQHIKLLWFVYTSNNLGLRIYFIEITKNQTEPNQIELIVRFGLGWHYIWFGLIYSIVKTK